MTKEVIAMLIGVVLTIVIGVWGFTGTNEESFNSQSRTVVNKSVTHINNLNP